MGAIPVERGEFVPVMLQGRLVKALPASGGKWLVKMLFSSNGIDLQGDQTGPEAISEANRDYLKGKVAINWNHETDPASQIGIIRDIWTDYVGNGPAGEPQWEGWCVAELLPSNRKARDVWALLQSGAELGASYEGITVQVQPDGLGGRILQRIWVRAIAITPTPVHPATSVRIAAASEARELNALAKSLSVGSGVVAADATGGQALRPQNLGGRVANTTLGSASLKPGGAPAKAKPNHFTAEDIGRALVYWKSPSLSHEQAKALVAELLDEQPEPQKLTRFVGHWLKRQGLIDTPIYKALVIRCPAATDAKQTSGGSLMDEETEGLEEQPVEGAEEAEAPSADDALAELAKSLRDAEEEEEEGGAEDEEEEDGDTEYSDTEDEEDDEEDDEEGETEKCAVKKALTEPPLEQVIDAVPGFTILLKSLVADISDIKAMQAEQREETADLRAQLTDIDNRSEEATTIVAKALTHLGAKARPLKGVASTPGAAGTGILEKSLTQGTPEVSVEDQTAFMIQATTEGKATPKELSVYNVDYQVPERLQKSLIPWKQTGRIE
jgi:hypothetical protein